MPLTQAQYNYLMANDAEFAQNVTHYGPPKNVATCNDANANPGDICLEEACVGGFQNFHFCDRVNMCTIRKRVPC
jgi:hypothetical protein